MNRRITEGKTLAHHPFTILRLVVALAIIAAVAAILFPVFSRARENARRSSCQSNLKQIGLATAQNTQAYDEHLPPGVNQIGSKVYWAQDTIHPYLASTRIPICLSNRTNICVPGSQAMNSNGG